tara:strand:+ start:288 stop:758 length:471 start_codon:yes stop_codon:yes gene_type:complete
MSLKKVLYRKYGILIKESESEFYNFLVENLQNKYDFKKALKVFSSRCDTRYFKKNKINEIFKELIKEEIGRDTKKSQSPSSSPFLKSPSSSAGNYTDEDLIQNEFEVTIEDTANTLNGKDSIYIEYDKENNKNLEVDEDYGHIFKRNYRNKKLNKK